MKVKPDMDSNGVAVVDLGYDLPEVKVTPDKVTEEEEEDPWALSDTVIHSTPWRKLTTGGKVKRILWEYIGRAISLIALLYLFICSIDLLSSAFQALAGKAAGSIFRNSKILENPVCGLMIGVLVTVLVQSSSTSTSIVVTMVASKLLTPEQAVFIVMGANIGTSVTNTIVSMGHSGNKNEFRRAFGGATVHDMFNWLSVLIILPIEAGTDYLTRLTEIILPPSIGDHKHTNVKFLKVITEPFTKLIILINKAAISDSAQGKDGEVVKRFCESECRWAGLENVTEVQNITGINGTFEQNVTFEQNMTISVGIERCNSLFSQVDWPDTVIGAVLLVVSLFLLSMCLVLIVKLLQSMLQGRVAMIIRKVINADFPGPFRYFTGYFAMLVGAGLTLIVQSSSIFTSTLTPLVGVGMISLERMYPLTLGSNIGTTGTGILAALASSSDGDSFRYGMQIALCHLFFNISGILLWFPIPILRKCPIILAKALGNTTANYRWFAIFYIIMVFFVLPGSVMALSLAGWYVLVGVGVPIIIIIIFIIIINLLQEKKPQCLPSKLRSWEWLPEPLHSLRPLDKLFGRCFFCKCCDGICYREGMVDDEVEEVKPTAPYLEEEKLAGLTNNAFEADYPIYTTQTEHGSETKF